MSDSSKTEEETESQEALAGMRLAAARREQDISVLDIAKELHLDEQKVLALENNDFEVLGAPVFAKGHLRKYADLVGVPTDDVLADYYSLNRSVGAPPVVGLARSQPRDLNLGRWVAGFFILAIIVATVAAVYWWLEIRVATPDALSGSATLQPFVSSPATTADAEDQDQTVQDLADESTEVAAEAVDAVGGTAEPDSGTAEQLPVHQPPPAAGVPQATVTMAFTGDCWAEISDASGNRLYFELGIEGGEATVTGAAPLRALFGDSANVSLVVNGQDYTIRDSQRSGRTARLTINAQ